MAQEQTDAEARFADQQNRLSEHRRMLAAWLEARESYVADYDRTVRPAYEPYLRFIGFGIEYAKLTISYLFLVNAGGLAGIVAIFPLVREANQTWLGSAIWPAVLFGLGLILVTGCAATAYFNHNYNAMVWLYRAQDSDNWLKVLHLNADRPATEAFAKINQSELATASQFSMVTTVASIVMAFGSIACGVAGGLIMIGSLAPRS